MYGCGRSETKPILANPGRIPSASTVGDVDADFFQADARWVYHGNSSGASLRCRVTMRSKTHEPRVLRLKKCWLSYDAGILGNEIAVSLLNDHTQAIDKVGFPPRGDLDSQILLGGEDVLPHESIGKDVWITVELSIDGTSLVVRKSTHVRLLM